MALLSGGSNCLRILAIIFNFIVFVCGLVLLGFSSYLLYSLNTTLTDFRPQEYGVVVGFLVIGFVICFLGFLGCCGAWKENVCMLTGFAVIVGLILTLEIIVVVLGFVYRDQLPELVRQFLINELSEAKKNSSPTMDNIQASFMCCGVDGPADYEKRPESCANYETGCQKTLEDFMMKYSTVLFIAAIVVALLQLAAIVVACCLRSSIRAYQSV
uniref:Tetraspanin n=1 Tax=Mesocestoides corti TaxID=53468 RepID=A0A5K3EFW9_MESCO